jgi:polyferredoxin
MKSKIRLIFQLVIVGLIINVIIRGWDIEAFCPMGGILSFGTQLYQNTMACSMSEVAIFMALALLIGALAVGKLFCSYICPIGFISEWFGKLGKKMRLHFLLPKSVDRPFRLLKYILLFFVLYYTITSSELFCKTFEPYYGIASGFDHDVVLWWSIAAVAITIIGSMLFKQFWCKYLCPLGAISNMFVNLYLFVIPFVIFFIVRLANPGISIAWLFGALAVIGYAWEAGFFRFFPLPITKITVDQDSCTHCNLCTKACPYGIKVDSYTKVDHPDCIICSECAYACKATKSIAINRSRKLLWLPPAVVIILPLFAFFLSTGYEFATLERRWGNFAEIENIAVYSQADISSIKCYGTSLSLYKKLEDKKGIYGLDTFAKSHSLKVYYNPDEITERNVKAAIFNPRRYKTRKFADYRPDSLAVWEVGIENFFDLDDNMNLVRMLRANSYVYGFETNFGEPVIARVFYSSDSTHSEEIRKLIDETKLLERKVRGKDRTYEMDFTCHDEGHDLGKVDRQFYLLRMFGAYNKSFNGFENVDIGRLDIYEIGMPKADNFLLRRRLPYLVSHISADSSIVRFATSLIAERTVAHIYFDPARMDTSTIYRLLMADTLSYFQRDGSLGKIENPFTFELPSRVFEASGHSDPVAEAKRRKLGADLD